MHDGQREDILGCSLFGLTQMGSLLVITRESESCRMHLRTSTCLFLHVHLDLGSGCH